MIQKTPAYPWWVHLLNASTDLLGKVLVTRLIIDSQDGLKPARGIQVLRKDALQPSIEPERITATTLIGQLVKGTDGKPLGRIEEITMDLTRGFISYLVLSSGGIFGFASKFYSIPLNMLTLKPEEKTFYVDIDKKKLKQMPEIDKHNWPKQPIWPATDTHNR
jgi:sporulation protein YlmC with PRC-barrel domain